MAQEGIILRTYVPHKHKLSVLDSALGRIECVPQSAKMVHRLRHGSHITYTLRAWRHVYTIYDVDILSMPDYWAQHDLLFLHHVLELSLYFSPLHSECNSLFQLIMLLYTSADTFCSSFYKKVFLCKFFGILGVYPVEYKRDIFLFRLISNPINSNFDTEVETIAEERLRRWILACIIIHPYAHKLKTLNFLTVTENHEKNI